MILDTLTEFCDDTALNTGDAGTYTIGNQIDTQGMTLGPTLRDLGSKGRTLYLVIAVGATAVTSATASPSGTKQAFSLVSDSVATLDSSPTTHFTTAAIEKASLAAGATVCVVPLPSDFTYERYLGIRHTTSVEAATAGKVNAFLTLDPSRWVARPDAL